MVSQGKEVMNKMNPLQILLKSSTSVIQVSGLVREPITEFYLESQSHKKRKKEKMRNEDDPYSSSRRDPYSSYRPSKKAKNNFHQGQLGEEIE